MIYDPITILKDKTVAHRLFEEVKDRYLNRQGGCVRILKKGIRKGDGAPISIVQLLPVDEAKKSGKKKAKKSGTSAKPGTKGKKGTDKRQVKSDDTSSDASASEKVKSG